MFVAVKFYYFSKWVLFVFLLKIMSFSGGSDGKEFACNAGDSGSTLGQEDALEKEMTTNSSILA